MGVPTQLIEQGAELYNKGDVDAFCDLYSDDVVLTTPDGRFEGRGQVAPYLKGLVDAFPDVRVTLGRRCEDGDLYFGEFAVRGTNTGPIRMPDGSEIPPTGKTVELPAAEIARVAGDRIVQHDMFWDNMSFLNALGLVPPA